MNHYNPSDNELNAYVDGELDAMTRAQIASAIASDPKLAKRAACLSALKAALPSAMQNVPDIDLGEISTVKMTRSWWRQPYAASLFLIVLVSALFSAMYIWNLTIEKHDPWHIMAQKEHYQWVSKTLPFANHNHLKIKSTTNTIAIPDLTIAKLTLNLIKKVWLGSVEATHMGFVGSRGCHISFFSVDAAHLLPAPKTSFPKDMRIAEWHTSTHNYLLLSTGMDQDRFDVLAKVLEKFTRQPAPFDKNIKQQLAESRRTSPPCSA